MKKVKKDYRYVESGLDNVILKDLPVYVCECGEEMPEISNVERLNRDIADFIVRDPSPLSGKEVRFLRKQMGMKAVELAELLGVTKQTISRWENEAASIGVANDKLIRMIFFRRLEECTGKIEKGVEEILRFIPGGKKAGREESKSTLFTLCVS